MQRLDCLLCLRMVANQGDVHLVAKTCRQKDKQAHTKLRESRRQTKMRVLSTLRATLKGGGWRVAGVGVEWGWECVCVWKGGGGFENSLCSTVRVPHCSPQRRTASTPAP